MRTDGATIRSTTHNGLQMPNGEGSMKRSLLGLTAAGLLGLVTIGVGAASVTASSGTTEPPGGSLPGGGGNIQAPGECGLGTGEPATGEPIKIGAMATNSPEADFTWITGLTA